MNKELNRSYLMAWAQTVPWMIHPPYLAAMADIAAGITLEFTDGSGEHKKVEALIADKEKEYNSFESSLVGPNNEVAVIKVMGPIFRYADFFTMMCGGATTESIAKDLRTARDDKSVKAIIIQIDSPGGEVAGISELGDMITQANSVKPTWAYGDGDVCSAAYWLGASAAKLIINNTAMVGSVGTVCSVRNPDHADDSVIEIVSSQSPMKRPDIRTTEGLAEVQGTADSLTQVFFEHLSRTRGVSIEHIAENFGRGGLLIGAAAVSAKMADEVGTFDGTVEQILAVVSGEPSAKEGKRMALADKIPVTAIEQEVPDSQPNMIDRIMAWATKRVKEDSEMADFLASSDTLPDPSALGLMAQKPLGNISVPVPTISPVGPLKPDTEMVPVASVDPRVAELEARIRQMETDQAAERDKITMREAALFAATMTRDGKIEPFEQQGIIQMYLQLESDDRLHPIDGTVSRLESFKSLQSSRTAVNRISEVVPVVPVAPAAEPDVTGERKLVLLQNNTETDKPDDGTGPMDEDTRRAHLSKTAMGRRALELEDKKKVQA